MVDDTTELYARMLVDKLQIPYMDGVAYEVVPQNEHEMANCVAHTNFYVDHDEVNQIRLSLKKWRLEALSDGDEYLAIIVPGEVTARVTQ